MQFIVNFFIFELFFGLNGKWLVLGGVSIRHWLFAVVLVLIYGKFLVVIGNRWSVEKQQGKSFITFCGNVLSSFKLFDWVLLGFFMLHAIWIIWIPYTELDINPAALKTSFSSALCMSAMLIYFPAVYLLRMGKVKWEKYRRFVIGCCISVSVAHILMFILEKVQWEQNHAYYFMERVFMAWEALVAGQCELPQVVMPAYAVRIIYGFSIFVLGSFYFIVGKKRWYCQLWTILNMIALLTTGTRSLLLGVIVGVVVFCVLDCIWNHWTKNEWKKVLVKAFVILATVFLIDGTLFDGMNVNRFFASFSVSDEALKLGKPQTLTWESSEYSMESEIRGTSNSNATRIMQIKYLLEQFAEKPLFGHGFAIGACDMQGLNYIVKVGLVGVIFWGIFLAVLVKRVVCMEKCSRGSGFPALYLVVAVLVDVQFQAMFGSLTMVMAVFLFLDLEAKEYQMLKIQQDVVKK